MLITSMMSYSYKPKLLDFLDKVCSLYESEYMLALLSDTGNLQSFIEKVCELAGAHGLPSKEYRVALSDFAINAWRIHLDKVYDCPLALVFFFITVNFISTKKNNKDYKQRSQRNLAKAQTKRENEVKETTRHETE